MTHDEYVRQIRLKIRQAAEAMLACRLTFIEGARRISALRLDAEFSGSDPDIQPFLAIESETETLPVGAESLEVAPQTLVSLLPEIDHAEDWARENCYLACRRLIERIPPAETKADGRSPGS